MTNVNVFYFGYVFCPSHPKCNSYAESNIHVKMLRMCLCLPCPFISVQSVSQPVPLSESVRLVQPFRLLSVAARLVFQLVVCILTASRLICVRFFVVFVSAGCTHVYTLRDMYACYAYFPPLSRFLSGRLFTCYQLIHCVIPARRNLPTPTARTFRIWFVNLKQESFRRVLWHLIFFVCFHVNKALMQIVFSCHI